MRLIHYRGAVPNFGDDLNDVLWPALRPDLIDDDPAHAFVGIGTIIGMACDRAAKLHVFSSGAGNDPVERWNDRHVRYLCVRGPVTCVLLGLEPDAAITDGAILAPHAAGFPRHGCPDGPVLVVPHFQTLAYPGWPEAAALCGFELLDPRGDPRAVVARLASARLVLTESLHGAILADTYGVPWRVFATSGNFGSTKFVDWCQSLGLAFDVTPLPPPNALQVLEQGRGRGEWGQTRRLTSEQAVAAFRARIAGPAGPGWRRTLKRSVARHGLLHRRLGYAPARTAEALAALARGEAQLSRETVRSRLQDRMLARLRLVGA